VTEGRRLQKAPVLLYMYAEPAQRGTSPISAEERARHRAEVDAFAAAVAGAEVRFAACSYPDWLAVWAGSTRPHAEALIASFAL
jgi:hypothetical protein